MIAIIDYRTGNLKSICNALDRIGAEYCLTDDPEVIRSAGKVLLPGVGEASNAMANLSGCGLCGTVKELRQPVLGICIGMQLMCRHSEEGDVDCLGIFDTDVRRLKASVEEGIKVPHMGWNSLTEMQGPLFQGIDTGDHVYYVHSFAADVCPDTVAVTENGVRFSAALCKDNFYGVQFHPEKSGAVGERILRNFVNL